MTMIPSVTLTTLTAAATAGALLVLAPRLAGLVSARLALRELHARFVAVSFHLAVLVLLPVAGVLTDACGVRPILATGSLLAAVAVALLAVTRGFGGALSGALLLGNSAACLWTASVVLMPAAFGLAHPAAALNGGFVFLGLGLLLASWWAEAGLPQFDSRRALGVLALLCLAPALLVALTEVEAFPALAAAGRWHDVPLRVEFWLIAAALLLCLPVEQGLTTWILRYLGEIGYAERRLAWLGTGFWLAFLMGRVGMALAWERGWVRPGAAPWVVLGLALLAAVVLGNLAGARGNRGPIVVLLSVGALLGPLTPTLVGVLFERFPAGSWGTALGGAVGVGSAGTYLVLPLLTSYTRQKPSRQVLWLFVLGLVLTALIMLALGIARTLPLARV